MTTVTFSTEESFRRMHCSSCGIVYYFPEKWASKAAEEGKSWQCPNGHSQWFGESTTDKLRRERDQLKQQTARLIEERREADAARNKAEQTTKRLKRRTAAGTCPCCQRTFSNMSTHMRKQHPTFVAEAVEAPKLKVVK